MAERNVYKAAQKRYRQKLRSVTLRLRKEKDADLIAWLDRQSNKQEVIRELIRREIEKKEQ